MKKASAGGNSLHDDLAHKDYEAHSPESDDLARVLDPCYKIPETVSGRALVNPRRCFRNSEEAQAAGFRESKR